MAGDFQTHQFLTRKQVEELTGLHWRVLRRLEKQGDFPRRVGGRVLAHREQVIKTPRRGLTSRTIRPVRAGKVRWRREQVEQWMQERDMAWREKVLAMVMKPGMNVEEKANGVFFTSPAGFVFKCGWHDVGYRPGTQPHDLWRAVWEERDFLKLQQCPNHPYCNTCRAKPKMTGKGA